MTALTHRHVIKRSLREDDNKRRYIWWRGSRCYLKPTGVALKVGDPVVLYGTSVYNGVIVMEALFKGEKLRFESEKA